MKIGLTNIVSCKIGSTQVNRVYIGSTLIWSYSAFDPDAQLFITNAGITNTTQQSAINTLVTNLKGYNLWTKMKAIYPFVGGTATTHKFNLKNPLDTDAAFRLAFIGGWLHSANGIQGNSFQCYVNTYFNPAVIFGEFTYSEHFSYYSRTIVPNTDGLLYDDFGIPTYMSEGPLTTIVTDFGLGPGVNIWTKRSTSGTEIICNLTNAGLNTQGLFTTSKVNQNLLVLYKNSTSLGSNTDTEYTYTLNDIIRLGEDNLATSTALIPKKQYAFATIGTGLTSTDTANLYTAIQAFQTTLGRQV